MVSVDHVCFFLPGIEQEGSNLSGVSGFIQWEEINMSSEDSHDGSDSHGNSSDQQVSATGKLSYHV